MVSVKDLAWLAGLLEGEGCFSTNGRAAHRGIRVSINMTDLDVLERVHALAKGVLGGPYYPDEKNHGKKPYWKWTVSRQADAAGLMMTVYPLMGERRQARIREMLERWRNAAPKWICPNGHKRSDSWNGRRCVECDRINHAKNRLENLELYRERGRLAQQRRRARIKAEAHGLA
jgi:hypothetical protein